MKTITINGVRYRLAWKQHWLRVEIRGPGMLSRHLPAGITLDTPQEELRRHAEATVAQAKANRKAASEMIQQRVREGKI